MPGHDSSSVDMSPEAVALRLRAVSNLCKLGLSIQKAVPAIRTTTSTSHEQQGGCETANSIASESHLVCSGSTEPSDCCRLSR